MDRKAKITIATLSIVLGIAVLVLASLTTVFAVTSATYKQQLNNVYNRNLYELVNNVNALEVDLSKLIATNSVSSQQSLLSDIYNTCTFANSNLSGLPISNHKIENVNKYVNTLGGYSFSLLTQSLKDEKLSQEDFNQVEKLYKNCQIALYDLNNYMASLSYDYSIVDDVKYGNEEDSSFDGGLTNINSTSSKVPSLIYDGPFSDSVVNKELNGLTGEFITQEEAYEIMKTHFSYFEDYEIEYVGDSAGKLATYNYNVSTKDHTLYVQLTQKGGFLLSINSIYEGEGNANLNLNQCENLAHNFASLLGFKNMYSVWSQTIDDITYINLAPIINRTIYYPDLIKVKIHTGIGNVVGWEASNYAYNHVERDAISPSISFEQAQSLLAPNLTVEERNLAYIPNEYVGESAAYEFVCSWQNYTYYIYIDVNTGDEINVLRVIETSRGSLLL